MSNGLRSARTLLLSATVFAAFVVLALGRSPARADQPLVTYDPQSGPVGAIVTFKGNVGDGALNNPPLDPDTRNVRIVMWDLSGPVTYALTIGEIPYDDSGAFEGQAVIPATLDPDQEPVDTPPLQVSPGRYLLVFHPVGDVTQHYFTVTDGQSSGTGILVGLGAAAVIGVGLAALAGRRLLRRRRTPPA